MIGSPPLMLYFLGPQMCSFNKDGGPGPYWRKILADKDEGELSKCRESLPLADGVSSPYSGSESWRHGRRPGRGRTCSPCTWPRGGEAVSVVVVGPSVRALFQYLAPQIPQLRGERR